MLTHHLTGIPYTFTAHAKDIHFAAQPALMRSKIKNAKAVVTVSEYNRRYLMSLLEPLAKNKVHCVYNGADLSQYEYRPSGEKPNGLPVILSVARLIEKKGLPRGLPEGDRKSTRLNSSHGYISYAVFCLKKKKSIIQPSARTSRETS